MLLAIQFLTIIPVRVGGSVTDQDMAKSSVFFPVAGAVQGLISALTTYAAMKLFPPETAAVLTIAALLLSNGGFDLDGLMDTFDGLAVKSTGDRECDLEKRLAVMKDSTAGAIGVIALVVVMLLKFTLIVAILRFTWPAAACAVIFVMPVAGKWVTVPAMYHGRPARPDGLGKIFIGKLTRLDAAAATFSAVFLILIALRCIPIIAWSSMLVFTASIMLLLYVFVLSAGRFFKARFGGLTGDHCGALTEISEILFLMGAYIWLQRFTW